ncbi:MAG TPA: hypothetical protein VMU33_18115 [Burkholderiaceae bacterium]|nr:hypothetical protein [Burkholderiaceae bacterium]
MAWHYTTGERYGQILHSEAIRPAKVGHSAEERAIAWFSVRQDFEPSLLKPLVLDSGAVLHFTALQLRAVKGGVFRFGIAAEHLIPWRGEALRRVAGLHYLVSRALERDGARRGGRPWEWYGSLAAVPVASCVVESMDEDGAWRSCATDANRPFAVSSPEAVSR